MRSGSSPPSRAAARTARCCSPRTGAAEFISGAILYDETIRQKSSGGTPLAEVLPSQGIVPGIKVDTGAEPLAGSPEETVTEGLDGLRDRLAEYHGMGARFAKWRAVIRIADSAAERRVRERECARARALRRALSGTAARADRRARGVDERRACDRALRGGHRRGAPRRVPCPLRAGRLVGVDAAQAQHGHRGQGLRAAGLGAGGRDGDAPLPAPARARGGARHRVPVGRPEGPGGDRASERDQPPAGAQALEDQLLLRARAPGCGAGGVAWAGREPEGRPAGPVPPGPLQRRCRARRVHRSEMEAG